MKREAAYKMPLYAVTNPKPSGSNKNKEFSSQWWNLLNADY